MGCAKLVILICPRKTTAITIIIVVHDYWLQARQECGDAFIMSVFIIANYLPQLMTKKLYPQIKCSSLNFLNPKNIPNIITSAQSLVN